MHILPQNVTAPATRWALSDVLYDAESGGVAIVRGLWDGEDAIGIRWNGSDDSQNDLGNPQSTGHPTWFILPGFLAAAVLAALFNRFQGGDVRVNKVALSEALKQCERLSESL